MTSDQSLPRPGELPADPPPPAAQAPSAAGTVEAADGGDPALPGIHGFRRSPALTVGCGPAVASYSR